MLYRLRAGEPVAAEVRRIATEELLAAISELRSVGDEKADRAVHRARRHIKKTHALFRLVRPALTHRHRASHKRLNLLEQRLARVADAEAASTTPSATAAVAVAANLRVERVMAGSSFC